MADTAGSVEGDRPANPGSFESFWDAHREEYPSITRAHNVYTQALADYAYGPPRKPRDVFENPGNRFDFREARADAIAGGETTLFVVDAEYDALVWDFMNTQARIDAGITSPPSEVTGSDVAAS